MHSEKKPVMKVYERLLEYFGPQGWWPGDTPEEIILGAILTQAVSWANVRQALENLKSRRLLTFAALQEADDDVVMQLIRPALYHRQKTRKIKSFLDFLHRNFNGDLQRMWGENLHELRPQLLSVWGIGPETADSILLYAGQMPTFVVDAYTTRIFSRLGLVPEGIRYDELKRFLEQNTDDSVAVYNEYHALLVRLGAGVCRKNRPLCAKCPISEGCKYFQARQEIDKGR